MVAIEQKRREKLYKRILGLSIFASTFSISTTYVASVIFKNVFLFYAFLICIPNYTLMLLYRYFTFENQKLSLERSASLFVFGIVVSVAILAYIAGGFGGAMISAYFLIIIISALLLNQRNAIYVSALIIIIYLTFFIGETFNIITPLITDAIVIKYSKAIIDFVAFFMIVFLITVISKNFEDSVKFYRLRSIRLSKIRKRLEILVNRRTRQLKQSNLKLRKAQTELRKSYKELKKLDVKKNEFISIASHELQTPMTTIHGFSQLLNKKKVLNNPKKRKKYLAIITSESERLSKLIKDMLDLSRIDLGTLKLNIETFDLTQLLKDMKFQMYQKIKEKGLKLNLKIDRNIPKMETDKEKLKQILINLISNATKYTEKGTITVEAHKQGRNIQFSVSDTGIGIPKKEFSKIFERFYQAGYSHRRRAPGAGLGLSVCKEFTEALGGKIWLTSKVGKGTTFYFTLPIKFKPSKK